MDTETLDNFRLDLGGPSESILALSLALMIFAVALGLRPEHFRFFKDQPRIYIGGVLAQLIGLPVITLILCILLNPHPSVALGMIIVACCPGGSVSNLIALFARANTALSISLTATSSILAAVITPFAILFWSGLYGPTSDLLKQINVDTGTFIIQTLMILALPLMAGMGVVQLSPKLADRLKGPLAALGGLALLGIIISACIRYWDMFLLMGLGLLVLVIFHNALAFMLGYLTGVFTRADWPSKKALSIEVGIQNSGLALVILVTQLDGLGGAAAIAGLWGTWHIIAGMILVGVFWIKDKRGQYV